MKNSEMRNETILRRWDRVIMIQWIVLCFVFSFTSVIAVPKASYAARVTQEPADDEPSLEHKQRNVSQRYRLLEQKLFTLFEYEQDNNPARSKLLKRAYLLSQENGTVEVLDQVVALMAAAELKDAESAQADVLKQLETMLTLLQSEDRGKRIRDELERHQDYLKEVERLLRIQKSLRGQTDGNVDGQRLAKSQGEAAERAEKLAEDIRENEESPLEADEKDATDDTSEDEPEKPGDNQPGESDEEPGESNDASKEGKAKGLGEDRNGKDKKGEGEPKDQNKPSEGESTDGEPNEPSNSDPSQSKPSRPNQQNQPGPPSEDGSSNEQPDQQENAPPENPVRKRIQAAEDRMRKAKQNLEQTQRVDAIEEMKEAEREIAAAKKELEEILRQLRGEEVERTLAMLEGRFRRMLEREVKILEQTKSLDQIVPEQRQADFEIRAGKIAVEQSSVATEASRALLLLREDGSSIAFPQTVAEMQQDMTQVASRLTAAKVGSMTIGIEEDIVETLNYLIEALVKEQKDREEDKQQDQPLQNLPQMDPGERPLVEQLAELRMLRGLQDRIYRRHTRYSKQLAEPDDIIGTANDPDLRSALERLAQKQKQLTEIAREIVNGINK
jgi:hypothetical protein